MLRSTHPLAYLTLCASAVQVEFEKQQEADPFGLGDFLKEKDSGKKRKGNALDAIGGKGHMAAR